MAELGGTATRARTGALLGALVVVLASLVVVGTPPAQAAQTQGGLTVSTASSTVNIRPDTPYSGPNGVTLSAAGNEFESFQVVLQAGGASVGNVNVFGDPAQPLTGPGGALDWSDTTFLRADYFTAVTRSDAEGATGRWADALIPEVDPIYHQNRSAFPLTVPANQNRVAWVDVFVPPGTDPGTYTGVVKVTGNGGVNISVPVQLDVLGFDLPSTSTLQTAFYTNYRAVCDAHTANPYCNFDEEQRWALHSLYERVALENRVTIANPWKGGNNSSPAAAGDEKAWFEQYLLPLINGTSPVNDGGTWSPLRLAGAKLSVVSQYGYSAGHCLQACWDQWEATATAKGFAPRMVLYGCDEAGTTQSSWTDCRTNYLSGLAGWPTVPNLVTGTINELTTYGVPGEVDVLVPPVNRLDDASGAYVGNQRANYDAWLGQAAGNRLWAYTSCLSHGCANAADPTTASAYFNGWPGYAIDAPAVQHRAMGMMAFRYDLSGELFWETTHRLPLAWNTCNAFDINNQNNSNCLFWDGTNGDGTLFYPGLGDANAACPNAGNRACIGGADDIPLETIRLKRIRDGREDYEYLHYLATHGKGTQARAVVDALFPTMHDATPGKDGATFDGARAQLVDLLCTIVPCDSTPPPAGPPAIAFTSDRTGNNDVFVMDADGKGQTNLTADAANDQFPAWSPDGTKIAFTSNRAGTNDIWVMNADGTGAVRRTTGAAADGASDEKPAWSPDGTTLAFVSDRAGNPDVYVMPATGGAATAITSHAAADYDPAFTRDGATIVFVSTRGATAADLYTVPASGGAATALTGGVADDDDTPDTANTSDQIAFDRVAGGDYDIMTMPSGGGAQTNRTAASSAHDIQPTWSPDDGALAFVSLRSDVDATTDWEIYRMAPDGSGVVALTRNAARDADPDWKATPSAPAAMNYTSITPKRVLDSRDGTGGHSSPWGANQTRTVQVAGSATTVPAGADAVMLNVTGVFPTAATHLTIWPTGAAVPTASNLNVAPGQTRPNLVLAKVGTGGTVSIRNNAGAMHVVADVVGYFDDDGGTDGRATAVVPERVLDSRDGTGTAPTRWGPGATRYVDVDTSGMPPGATAVVLNVTATNASAATHVTVWSSDEAQPTASNLNVAAGETAANLVVSTIGTGGVAIYNNSGSVDVIADVVGYFATTPDGEVTAIVPTRVLDSRSGVGGYSSPWPANTARPVTVVGGSTGVPADAEAVVLNVTGCSRRRRPTSRCGRPGWRARWRRT
ncbi:MAG: DUF4091 domain-containing protein [Acidimicrobiales bacterium]